MATLMLICSRASLASGRSDLVELWRQGNTAVEVAPVPARVADLDEPVPESQEDRPRQQSVAVAVNGPGTRGERELMPETSQQPPHKVALFSGHMVPPDKVPIAAQAISEALADLGIGREDIAITCPRKTSCG
jgi:hypothetical protein